MQFSQAAGRIQAAFRILFPLRKKAMALHNRNSCCLLTYSLTVRIYLNNGSLSVNTEALVTERMDRGSREKNWNFLPWSIYITSSKDFGVVQKQKWIDNYENQQQIKLVVDQQTVILSRPRNFMKLSRCGASVRCCETIGQHRELITATWTQTEVEICLEMFSGCP